MKKQENNILEILNLNEKLNTIHKKIQDNIETKKKSEEAQILQKFLSDLKIRSLNPPIQATNSGQVIANAIQNNSEIAAMQELDALITSIKGAGSSNRTLFSTRHKDGQVSLKVDDIFEQEIAEVFAALFNQDPAKVFNLVTGQDKTKVIGMMDGKKVRAEMRTALKQYYTHIINETNKQLQHRSTRLRKTAGKIDIDGRVFGSGGNDIIEIKIFGEIQPSTELKKIRQIVAKSTFSLKNYAFTQKNSLPSVHLGNTNLYKAITGPINYFSPNEDANKIFNSGMYYLSQEKSFEGAETISEHFQHLRAIYELSGAGLIEGGLVKDITLENMQQNFVDFIIYNNPTGLTIYVKDTASLIQDEILNSNKQTPLLSYVQMSASVFNAFPRS